MTKENAVMPSLKGNAMVNVVPTKENVDYYRIYLYTKDPGFGRFAADRDLNKKHVAEIQDAIEHGKYGSKFIAPVRVDINTLNTSDGKHRYQAFIKAWNNGSVEPMKVQFEDLPEEEKEKLDVIVDINSTMLNWNINAYENRLKKEGNENMLNIESFALTHPLCQKISRNGEVTGYYPRYAYAILLGRNATKEVKNGTISISKKQLEFGEKMNGELEMLVKALGYEMNSWFESFAHAWYNIRQNDKANSAVIDEIGLETICKHIYKYFNGWHPVTRKTEWENRFRAAIWEIKRGIENKSI